MPDNKTLLTAAQAAFDYREKLPHLAAGAQASREELLSLVNADLPDDGESPDAAIQMLIKGAERGLNSSAGPRYFGFVIGGSTPASVATDWLASAWDQNAQSYNTSPAASVIEEIVAKWLLDLLGLPKESGVGFVTGAQMANFTALTVARNAVLQKQGWDVEADGLQSAPHINVICSECCHATVRSAIRLMGLGVKNVKTVSADSEGRIELGAFNRALAACKGPTIVCAQAGNVNTGAFDAFGPMAASAKERGAWLHIDGAFGLWACASPKLKNLAEHINEADSWAADAHKWLNVPYDSGMVIIRDAALHRNLKTARCAYSASAGPDFRDGSQWAPENSRRARGFVLYAALRNLGRKGVRQVVDNCCEIAQTFAAELAKLPHVRVLNRVVLNQVLFRIEPESAIDTDAFNKSVALRIQRSGVCWMGTTQWRGQTALRISVSNWSTTTADAHQSIASVKNAIEQETQSSQ
ncbi:MAG: aminotransferase class V-fold PLP-dependent enzyme [Elusimicrobiales bacterium]|nr:aminotransferase class V-fold PLP-dependent enzyme [Elusimicrobiales bacterium]